MFLESNDSLDVSVCSEVSHRIYLLFESEDAG